MLIINLVKLRSTDVRFKNIVKCRKYVVWGLRNLYTFVLDTEKRWTCARIPCFIVIIEVIRFGELKCMQPYRFVGIIYDWSEIYRGSVSPSKQQFLAIEKNIRIVENCSETKFIVISYFVVMGDIKLTVSIWFRSSCECQTWKSQPSIFKFGGKKRTLTLF